jgi:hypothetical protein
MLRRLFIKNAIVSSTVLFGGCSSAGFNRSGLVAVDTPEKRASYLARMLRKICIDIGPHFVGTEANRQVVSLVRHEMLQCLPEVYQDTFIFDRWSIEGEPRFLVGERLIDAYMAYGSAGTPDEGLTGFLRKNFKENTGYEIIDQTGKIIAYAAVSEEEKAVPKPCSVYNVGNNEIPVIIVGKSDISVIEDAVSQKKVSRLFAKVSYMPNGEAQNVIGTFPGETKDEILIIAHLDTAYNSPGANENTASLILMLMIAYSLSGKKLKKTIRFIASNGGEYDYSGIKHYARIMEKEETLKNIKFILNFHSVSWGMDLCFAAEDTELISVIRNIRQELELKGSPKFLNHLGFESETLMFKGSGARILTVDSEGKMKNIIKSRPQDTPDNVRPETVEMSFLLFCEYIKRLQNLI